MRMQTETMQNNLMAMMYNILYAVYGGKKTPPIEKQGRIIRCLSLYEVNQQENRFFTVYPTNTNHEYLNIKCKIISLIYSKIHRA